MNFHATNASGERQRAGAVVAWTTSRAGPQAASKAPAVGHLLARGVVLLVVAALASGCGFQLRSWDLTSAFESAHIAADASVTIDAELRRALEQAGLVLVDEQAGAGAVIRLSDQRELRRGVSTTLGARTAEYEMTLSLAFSAQDGEGNELVGERRIRAERTFRLDQSNPAATREEQSLITLELANELVRQIILSLSATARADQA